MNLLSFDMWCEYDFELYELIYLRWKISSLCDIQIFRLFLVGRMSLLRMASDFVLTARTLQ